jgi:hypothetical protein
MHLQDNRRRVGKEQPTQQGKRYARTEASHRAALEWGCIERNDSHSPSYLLMLMK